MICEALCASLRWLSAEREALSVLNMCLTRVTGFRKNSITLKKRMKMRFCAPQMCVKYRNFVGEISKACV